MNFAQRLKNFCEKACGYEVKRRYNEVTHKYYPCITVYNPIGLGMDLERYCKTMRNLQERKKFVTALQEYTIRQSDDKGIIISYEIAWPMMEYGYDY